MQTDCQPKATPMSTRQPEGALPSEPMPPTKDEWAHLEALELLRVMGERWSYARVSIWVRSLAAMHGQGLGLCHQAQLEPEMCEPAHERAGAYGDHDSERPSDRCLADGAALINSVCVQCGRDNS